MLSNTAPPPSTQFDFSPSYQLLCANGGRRQREHCGTCRARHETGPLLTWFTLSHSGHGKWALFRRHCAICTMLLRRLLDKNAGPDTASLVAVAMAEAARSVPDTGKMRPASSDTLTVRRLVTMMASKHANPDRFSKLFRKLGFSDAF